MFLPSSIYLPFYYRPLFMHLKRWDRKITIKGNVNATMFYVVRTGGHFNAPRDGLLLLTRETTCIMNGTCKWGFKLCVKGFVGYRSYIRYFNDFELKSTSSPCWMEIERFKSKSNHFIIVGHNMTIIGTIHSVKEILQVNIKIHSNVNVVKCVSEIQICCRHNKYLPILNLSLLTSDQG